LLSDVASITGTRPSLHDGADPPTVLDRLLSVLSELAPEAEPQDLAEFRSRLDEYRRGLAHTPSGPDLAAVGHSCLQTCEQFLEASRQYARNRDAELLDMIATVRQSAFAIVSEAADFNDRLSTRLERIQQLSLSNDIGELKRLLDAELQTLATAVCAERQRNYQQFSNLASHVEMLRLRLAQGEGEPQVDPLTRAATRATFERTLQEAVPASRDTGLPLSVAMVEVDDFKRLVAEHGAAIGDRVLLCASLWLGRVVRRTDLIARHHGEVFGVILNGAGIHQVEARLTRALVDLAAHSFEYDADGEMRTVRFTASIGITELASADSPADVVTRADEALGEARRKGRNRVVVKKRSMLATLLSRHAKSA